MADMGMARWLMRFQQRDPIISWMQVSFRSMLLGSLRRGWLAHMVLNDRTQGRLPDLDTEIAAVICSAAVTFIP